MKEAMKKPTGCPRHLFTAVAATGRGKGGFRTVAHSPELSGLVDAIEGLVDGYKAADAGTPACRQLLPVPGRRGQIYAFTVFTPTGPTPDGRDGNYWAETLIVPADWLAAGGWDTATAFDSLEWWGPQDAAKVAKGFPAVVLPTLEPGPLDRLERLVEVVPEDHLFPLLLAVIQQARGLRKIRLLEKSGADPKDLEDVVSLLPLIVPPALRTYREDDGRRCLTWRTRSPRGAMAPATDLTGFPAFAADDLEREGRGSAVIDLGGRVLPPSLRGRFGEGYARWLHRTLRQGNWSELEALYAEEISGSAPSWFADFSREVDEEVPVFAARQAAWKARDAAEGQAWALLESHRRQLEESLAELRRELDQSAQAAAQKWRQALDRQRQDLDARAAQYRAAAPRPEAASRGLDRRVKVLEDELRRLRKHSAGVEPVGERQESIALQARPRPSQWQQRLQERDAVALIPKIAAGLLLIAALSFGGWWGWQTFGGRTATPEETTSDAVTQASETLHEQRRESLLQKLQVRDTAVLLMRTAAADRAYEKRVNVMALALTLGKQNSLSDDAGKALLQQALGITVDGQWGPGSSKSLKDNLPADCQACASATGAGFAWNGPEASCFLIVHLQLDDPPCPGSSPWSQGRAWSEAEAENVLGLIRAAATSSTNAQISAQLVGLDPAQTPTLWSEIGSPNLRQAEMLFDLAYSVVAKDPQAKAPDKLSADRTSRLAALLEEVGPETSTGSQAASGGASG